MQKSFAEHGDSLCSCMMISETVLFNGMSDPGKSAGQGQRNKKFKGKMIYFGKLVVSW